MAIFVGVENAWEWKMRGNEAEIKLTRKVVKVTYQFKRTNPRSFL